MGAVIKLRIDVNGVTYLLPTFKDSSIQITKRIQSIDTIESSQGVITKQTFRIPLIDEAIEAFGDLTELESLPKIDVRKSINGSILINGFPRFEGSFQIINIYVNPKSGIKEVELIFKGNETNLKATLSKIQLSELLKGETIPYNAGEIAQYINDTDNYIGNGYAWPMIDYGQKFAEDGSGRRIYNDDNPLTQLDFKPAIFMRHIFDKLPIPITVDSSANDLLNQVIPLHNTESQYPTLNTSPKDYTGNLTVSNNIVFNNYEPYYLGPVDWLDINFNSSYNYNQSSFSTINDSYTCGATGLHAFRYSFKLSIKNSVSIFKQNAGILFRLKEKNSSNVLYQTQGLKIESSISARVYDFSFAFNVFLERNKEYEFQYAIRTFQQLGLLVDYTILAGTTIAIDTSPSIIASSVVDVAKSVPKLTAWDCVKTIIAQCNGILEPKIDGFNIKPWVKWIDEGDVYNISDKVDSTSDIEIEPTCITGAKSIKLSYQEDEDFLNKLYKEKEDEVYGTASVDDTGTDFTDEEFSIDIPFAATPMTYIAGTSVIIPKLMNTELNTIKGKPRLLYHSNFTPLGSNRMGGQISLKDLFFAGLVPINVGLPFVGHWESISGGYDSRDYNFGTTLNFFASTNFPNQTLYERFWKRYIQETNGIKSRLIKIKLSISQTDFDRLNLNEKVYYNNSLFSFTEIDNFDLINEGVVNCKLVLRNTIENTDIAPYYPFNIVNGVVQFKDSINNSIITNPNAAKLEESCNAYGYFYDTNLNLCVQRGGILES